MKLRKRRTKSRDMCEHCGNIGCDPMGSNSGASKKIRSRMTLGLCPGCGNKPCTCKTKS